MSSALNNNTVWTIELISEYVSKIVAKESGNVLGKNQSSMVKNRVNKRMIDLGNITPTEYYDYLQKNYNKESEHLVTILTTHHTFFFREFSHFQFLLENIDSIVNNVKARGENKIRILSAACSRGQEVYSLAMFLNTHLQNYPGMDYEIIGTDIDKESVNIARNGVYNYSEVKSIPQNYLSGNWQRGTKEISRFAKIKKHLKEKCKFSTMNLLDMDSTLRGQKFDLIFCRNVFIYFEEKTITRIVENLKSYISHGGLLITGLSESLKSIDIPKKTLAPSIYCFDFEEETKSKTVPIKVFETAKSIIPERIRVLAVDDSRSVLKLLTKIFESDPSFELVGTAENGEEAVEFLKNNKVDAMTLDIHMPVMDGVEYLKKNFKKGSHPHVVIVSSASREDTRYAQESIKYGASDFVEKPALNNISQRADEIKNKIKMSFLNNQASSQIKQREIFTEKFEISKRDEKARVLFATYSDLFKVKSCLKELDSKQPPIIIFFEGNANYLEVIKNDLAGLNSKVKIGEGSFTLNSEEVYICDFSTQYQYVFKQLKEKKVSSCVFGIASKTIANEIINLAPGQLLLEDIAEINLDLKEVASDIFPWTSFSHIGTEYLAGEK